MELEFPRKSCTSLHTRRTPSAIRSEGRFMRLFVPGGFAASKTDTDTCSSPSLLNHNLHSSRPPLNGAIMSDTNLYPPGFDPNLGQSNVLITSSIPDV